MATPAFFTRSGRVVRMRPPMSDPVLVLGATGTQGGAVARALLAAGRPVRALVRDRSSARAQALVKLGAALVSGDLGDVDSLTCAFTDVPAVYAVTTPFAEGTDAEERQGETIVTAAERSGLEWLLLASVASADIGRSVPHFASKWRSERRLAASEVPWTVIAPSYFYENLASQLATIVRDGVLPMALPPDKPLAQVSLQNLGQLVAQVLVERDEHLGVRVEVAGDAPTPAQMAQALGARYAEIPLDVIENVDMHAMYAFLSAVGYSVDPLAVRERYPQVGWVSFADWAHAQTST